MADRFTAPALLAEAVEAWGPAFADPHKQISGANLVEWFAGWPQRAQGASVGAFKRAAGPVDAASGANHYRVGLEIDVWAKTPVEAAQKALAIQRKPDSWATVFNVREQQHGQTRVIDLGENAAALRLNGPTLA